MDFFLTKWQKVLWGLAALGLVFLGVLWSYHDHREQIPSSPHTAQVIFEDFSLTDQHGQPFRFRQGRTPFVLLYFGYTYCPDICPLALTHMTQALQRLAPSQSAQIQPLFVTVDPARDTQEKLAQYVELFHPRFMYLTGSESEITPVLKAYGVFVQRAPSDETSTEYLLDHSSMIYWMKRDGTLLGRFSHATSPVILADTLSQHVLQ